MPSSAVVPPPTRTERGAAIGAGIAWLSTWALRLLVIALGLVVIWQLIARMWVVVLPVTLAALLASFLFPLVVMLRRRGVRPPLAATAVLLLGVGLMVGLFTLVTQQVVDQADELAASATQGVQQVRTWLTGPPFDIDEKQINAAADVIIARLQGSATAIATGVLAGVGVALNALVTGLLVLVLTFLILKDGHLFIPWLQRIAGRRAGAHLERVGARTWVVLGSFIRAQAAVGLIDALFIGAALVILGVPLALPLTLLTFLGAFVPIVGAVAIGILSVLVALVTKGLSTALILLLVIFVVQQLEGNVLSPILQGRSLKLHPAVVILAVTAGGSLFGVVGAFLAVPVAAVAAEILRYLGECVDAATEEPQDHELDLPATHEPATMPPVGEPADAGPAAPPEEQPSAAARGPHQTGPPETGPSQHPGASR